MAEENSEKRDGFVPKVVLGVAAHPDDLDFGSAGTIAAWTKQGVKVYYLVLTNGNKGSSDLSADPAALTQMRRQEQRDAAKLLGVEDVFFCDYEDGALMVTMDVKRDIARVIRTVRPDTVITMDPSMLYDESRGFINHPDHRAAGQSALDAVFPLARDHLSLPELFKDEGLKPHNVATVLLTNFQKQNFFVDITDTFETKLAAIEAHSSQIPDIQNMCEWMRQFAEKSGETAGYSLAEGFLRIDVR
jgi:LmbE family N-acetylglucosaminyl deacetylase